MVPVCTLLQYKARRILHSPADGSGLALASVLPPTSVAGADPAARSAAVKFYDDYLKLRPFGTRRCPKATSSSRSSKARMSSPSSPARRRRPGRSCKGELGYLDKDAPMPKRVTWTDAVLLLRSPHGWAVDDIAYGGDWPFGHADQRLTSLLNDVVRETRDAK
jgi:hypothetical protein